KTFSSVRTASRSIVRPGVTMAGAACGCVETAGATSRRVRLVGPIGNRNGIGAQLRLKFGERYGASRELHAGSGYWSQDSGTVVLAHPADPSHLWVRWPGGKVTETELTPGAGNVSIDWQGEVRVIR